MPVSIPRGSRLNFSKLIIADGIEFWDLPEYPTIPTSSTDIKYIVQSVDRLDTLANKYYGDPYLWWVIALANSIDLMPTDLIEGSEIIIPSPSNVFSKIIPQSTL